MELPCDTDVKPAGRKKEMDGKEIGKEMGTDGDLVRERTA